MKLSDINEYIQTLAALGAIAALLAVGYEIRQNNNLAKMQALAERRSMAQQAEMEYYDPEITKVWVKSIMEPESMTLPEIRAMDAYLYVFLLQAGHIWSLEEAGLMSKEESREWILDGVDFYFGNTFAQTWWETRASGWSHVTGLDEAISSLDENQVKRELKTLQRMLKERVSAATDAD